MKFNEVIEKETTQMRHYTEQEINEMSFEDMPSDEPNEDAALELLYTAQEHMLAAIDALRRYVEVTGDRHTEAYILDHLTIMTTANHGFMSRNANIEQLIANVERGEDY
jgi:hypothetical protein